MWLHSTDKRGLYLSNSLQKSKSKQANKKTKKKKQKKNYLKVFAGLQLKEKTSTQDEFQHHSELLLMHTDR